jgi:starvation-inducible DNA-binding protein
MNELSDQLKVALASVFAMYLKAHNFHWNVTGPDFAQYHAFLGTVYDELHDSVDMYAEQIRTLDSVAPGGLARYYELSVIDDANDVPAGVQMLRNLSIDNGKMLDELYAAAEMAEALNKRGIVNFLEDRIMYHDKLGWMLRSFS